MRNKMRLILLEDTFYSFVMTSKKKKSSKKNIFKVFEYKIKQEFKFKRYSIKINCVLIIFLFINTPQSPNNSLRNCFSFLK